MSASIRALYFKKGLATIPEDPRESSFPSQPDTTAASYSNISDYFETPSPGSTILQDFSLPGAPDEDDSSSEEKKANFHKKLTAELQRSQEKNRTLQKTQTVMKTRLQVLEKQNQILRKDLEKDQHTIEEIEPSNKELIGSLPKFSSPEEVQKLHVQIETLQETNTELSLRLQKLKSQAQLSQTQLLEYEDQWGCYSRSGRSCCTLL